MSHANPTAGRMTKIAMEQKALVQKALHSHPKGDYNMMRGSEMHLIIAELAADNNQHMKMKPQLL
ncbi:hypothetical protein NXY40_21710 [Phocaeicola vulgatus]|nr:hypothetical protein [Phocaeicola vulgatus]